MTDDARSKSRIHHLKSLIALSVPLGFLSLMVYADFFMKSDPFEPVVWISVGAVGGVMTISALFYAVVETDSKGGAEA